jgi:hypothetical protein
VPLAGLETTLKILPFVLSQVQIMLFFLVT